MNDNIANLVQLLEEPSAYFTSAAYPQRGQPDGNGNVITSNGIIIPDDRVQRLEILIENEIKFSCEKMQLEQMIVATIRQYAVSTELKHDNILQSLISLGNEIGRRCKRGAANTLICSQQFYDFFHEQAETTQYKWIIVDTNEVFIGYSGNHPSDRSFGVVEHETTYDVILHPNINWYWFKIQT